MPSAPPSKSSAPMPASPASAGSPTSRSSKPSAAAGSHRRRNPSVQFFLRSIRHNTMSTSSKKLTSKVALVTGASKGIGASIAKHLAAEGASVVVNYASSKAGADKVVAEIAAAGGKAIAIQGDVANPADIVRLVAETKTSF